MSRLRQDVKATYRKLVKVLTKPDLAEPEGDSALKLADALGKILLCMYDGVMYKYFIH